MTNFFFWGPAVNPVNAPYSRLHPAHAPEQEPAANCLQLHMSTLTSPIPSQAAPMYSVAVGVSAVHTCATAAHDTSKDDFVAVRIVKHACAPPRRARHYKALLVFRCM